MSSGWNTIFIDKKLCILVCDLCQACAIGRICHRCYIYFCKPFTGLSTSYIYFITSYHNFFYHSRQFIDENRLAKPVQSTDGRKRNVKENINRNSIPGKTKKIKIFIRYQKIHSFFVSLQDELS
jgi:hypothetical protein